MESSIKVTEDRFVLLEYAILYKSAGEPVRTAGTSAGVMESSIKVLEDRYGPCWNIYWSDGIVYKSAGGPFMTTGTSAGVVYSSIIVQETPLVLLEHQLELWNRL